MLSIVIVNYNAGALLSKCIDSIFRETRESAFDVCVVDNQSIDGSAQEAKQRFPQIQLIANQENVGFGKACNQALRQSNSKYVLLFNPDATVHDRAIEKMLAFMEQHRQTGVAGCKVLNEDRTLQWACHRGIPTPGVAFFYLLRLKKLFPNSKLATRYHLSHLDMNAAHEVDAVSGSFLMIRREVIERIGGLDEEFFMYGEDMDWCLRAKQAGWKVTFNPDAEVIHLKGESSKKNSRKARYEFYRAMYVFHKKHFAKDTFFLLNWIVFAGIFSVAHLLSWCSIFSRGKVGS